MDVDWSEGATRAFNWAFNASHCPLSRVSEAPFPEKKLTPVATPRNNVHAIQDKSAMNDVLICGNFAQKRGKFRQILQILRSGVRSQYDRLASTSSRLDMQLYDSYGISPIAAQESVWLPKLVSHPDAHLALLTTLFPQCLHIELIVFLCYYATAVLVLMPGTRIVRLAILPLSLWIYAVAVTSCDPPKLFQDERFAYLNQARVLLYLLFALRTIVWSFQPKHFWRVKSRAEITPELYDTSPPKVRTTQLLVDALDLCCNWRGCGWNWSRHIPLPHETRSTKSTTTFAAATVGSLLLHLIIVDFSHYAMQWLAPSIAGSTKGASIFDAGLPPLTRYSKSTALTLLSTAFISCGEQAAYDSGTLIGVLVFRQDMSLWPPLFQAPFLCTSITEFWGKGWHQLLRDTLTSVAGKPLSVPFGRLGGVVGAFLLSGLYHSLILWGSGRGTDFVRITGFFVMCGVGIGLERMWRNLTGRRVCGWYGRVWGSVWMCGWAHIFVEAYAARGVFGSIFIPPSFRLTTYLP
ncbi:putative membrane bound O-acyl transferase family protein [Lyophyllum shimeji]|uniref:Membrane bound O-acyl transferase family protein n=1 Tax=Lyophyllum shimeji TaxID=47721 RepID=A0A9P3URF6_LYOSH|nr:putative membrane bound O-acyl transferase family protein [Lyophyllum shimeji]